MTTTASEITVYGKSGPCGMCDATYRKLDKLGLDHTPEKLEDHPDMVEECKNLGLMEAPIVVVRYTDGSMERWSGYRPDRLGKLGRQFAPTS